MLLPETLSGVIVEARRFDIHDQANWQLFYRVDGSDKIEEARLALAACYPDPARGDAVVISRVMGEAVEIRRASEGDARN